MLNVLLAEENRKWVTLAAVSFGLFMIMLDNTVVNVALPTMQRDLHVSISQLEWVVIAYALTFASLLITGGKLADLYGRRRIFVFGLVVFTLSSLACGLAPSAGFLIGARAVQGAGAALMNPATLSIIVATFPPKQPYCSAHSSGSSAGSASRCSTCRFSASVPLRGRTSWRCSSRSRCSASSSSSRSTSRTSFTIRRRRRAPRSCRWCR